MRCHHSVKQCALRARSTHDVHHAIVEVNVLIGVLVVHCELQVVVRVHVALVVVCDEAGTRRESGLCAAAWILWLRNEYGNFIKVSCARRVLRNASAMIVEREALRVGIEHLRVLFPTVVNSFDFQVENSGRTVQYKLLRSLCVSSVFIGM